ncbi:hypothetical protein [Elioraea sp.]|jgi:hypothetical protein|uniref:hypothetical protein n=1 Tax=Elioraea sp. TaxID=2185103 RepID=UPI003F6EA692
MTRLLTLPAALVFGLIIGLPASAQAPQDPPPVPPVQMVPPSSAASTTAVFTTAEAHAIRDYYQEHPDRVGPVQAPGIAESLTRGATLPARLDPRPVPDDLKAKLAERPGHEILIAGSVALLVESESRVIRDLLRDALPPRE